MSIILRAFFPSWHIWAQYQKPTQSEWLNKSVYMHAHTHAHGPWSTRHNMIPPPTVVCVCRTIQYVCKHFRIHIAELIGCDFRWFFGWSGINKRRNLLAQSKKLFLFGIVSDLNAWLVCANIYFALCKFTISISEINNHYVRAQCIHFFDHIGKNNCDFDFSLLFQNPWLQTPTILLHQKRAVFAFLIK